MQAHAEEYPQDTAVDEWAVLGNAAADRCAAMARQNMPAHFWTLWQQLHVELHTLRTVGCALHAMYTDMAHSAQQTHTILTQFPEPAGFVCEDPAEVDLELCKLATMTSRQLPKRFQIAVTPYLLEWLADVTTPSDCVGWFSFHQLLLDFQMFSGQTGPCSDGQNWTSSEPDHYDHPQRVKWFTQYFTNLAKTISFSPDIQQRRPVSNTLAFWCGHVQVCLPTARLQAIDDHIRIRALVLPVRQVQQLSTMVPGWDR